MQLKSRIFLWIYWWNSWNWVWNSYRHSDDFIKHDWKCQTYSRIQFNYFSEVRNIWEKQIQENFRIKLSLLVQLDSFWISCILNERENSTCRLLADSVTLKLIKRCFFYWSAQTATNRFFWNKNSILLIKNCLEPNSWYRPITGVIKQKPKGCLWITQNRNHAQKIPVDKSRKNRFIPSLRY